MEATNASSERKSRTCTRTSNATEYTESDLDELLECDKHSTKDLKPKRRARKSALKSKVPKECETRFCNVKTNDDKSNNGLKLFPIFTSSPDSRVKQKLSPTKVAVAEIKCDETDYEKSVQNALILDERRSIKNKNISTDGGISAKRKKVGFNNTSADVFDMFEIKCSSKISNCKEVISEIVHQCPMSNEILDSEMGKIATVDNVLQINSVWEQECSVMDKNKKLPIKRKRKTKIAKDFTKVSESTSSKLDSKAEGVIASKGINVQELYSKPVKTEGIQKLFPIFDKTPDKWKPHVKRIRKNKVTKEIINSLTEPSTIVKNNISQPTDDSLNEAVSVDNSKVMMDSLCITESNMLEDNICQSIENSLNKAVSVDKSETHTSTPSQITIPSSRRSCKKQKLINTGNAVDERLFDVRMTRSKTMKSDCSLHQIIAPSPLSFSKINSEVEEINKSIQKKKRRKVKPDVLKLLPQSRKSLQKVRGKNQLKLKNEKALKVFPLFSKPYATVLKNKSIAQVNSTVHKKLASKSRSCSSSKSCHEEKKEYDSFQEGPKHGVFPKNKQKNNRKTRKVKKYIAGSECEETELLQLSEDSVIETSADSLKDEILKKSKNGSDKVDVAKSVKHKDPVTVNKIKECSSSFKEIKTHLSFPLFSHSNLFEWVPDLDISNYNIKEELDVEVLVPEWNTLIGLTDIRNVDQPNMLCNAKSMTDMLSSAQTAGEISENEHIKEIDNALWTEISSDYNLKEGVSEATINDLNSWLLQWKSKFTKNNKLRHADSDDSFDSFTSDSNDSLDDSLSNSVIIMGPPGSGKTSLVFSLASDHGFKVLEVNASSCRSGRNISHHLKEALESYHVENVKTLNLNCGNENFNETSENSHDAVKKRKVKVSANNGIATFFQKEKKNDENKNVKIQPIVKDFLKKSGSETIAYDKTRKKPTVKLNPTKNTSKNETLHNPSSRSISTQTIILFDDIDVVFQEDEGLWSTIRGFLKISKKPVIFTVGRNLAIVKANLDSDIRVLHLRPMMKDLVLEKLDYQYKKHDIKNTSINLNLLVNSSNDVRRNLLHVQFWSQRYDVPSPVKSNEELLSVNTFLLGSLNFSAKEFISFVFENHCANSYSIVSEYHKIGYDVLYCNLFTILNIMHETQTARKWQTVMKKVHDDTSSPMQDTGLKFITDNDIGPTDLWKEACEIFELKKQTLKKGSCSDDLFVLSDTLEDFSFTDTLKGCFCRNMKWISLPERVKKWTCGLPMCNELNDVLYHDFILDITSLIQILRLQNARNKYKCNHDLNNENTALILEHPFMNFDDSNECKVEMQMENVASGFSASHLLNKTVFNLDYLSTLKIMCQDELLRRTKSSKRSNRFLHYFDSISLLIDKFQIEQLLN